MKKTLYILPLLFSAFAQADFNSMYFDDSPVALTEDEKAAINLINNWNKTTAIKPITGSGGVVKYVYGTQRPSVLCAPMQVCDIELQAGEQVNSINLGDTTRWLVEPAISGSGANEVQHIIVKPLDSNLETSLIIATDRRTYNIQLRSSLKQYMPQVSFIYANEAIAKFDKIKNHENNSRKVNTINSTNEYLGDLDFNYTVKGKYSWAPVRVYNDGRKTIIEVPKSVSDKEAPTLLVVREKEKAFAKTEQVLVNYRIAGNRYIVDSIFDKAVLIVGVGRNQQKVTITKN